MAAYEVIGTGMMVSGSKRKWSVRPYPFNMDDQPLATGFTSKREAVQWATDNKQASK
ncbi:hypothetical protein SEA_OCTOBIEN14_138 [Gordonia phage Octobien14]|uniref:Uncharacterized protein n=1 Tax=Gordonia phage Octobien14 TaxID=2483673 RepID=A0A3G3MA40_9CAUD|nr:hypothetical protein L3Y22_gp106 [Gordonia phage Octobien14]AYR03273.1 hypothetical protein SEA_OCTOBIEN14_138 [Gordonia phage Octobien14]